MEKLAWASHHPSQRRRRRKKKEDLGHAFRLGVREENNKKIKIIQKELQTNQPNQSNQIKSRLQTKVFSATSVTCIDDKDVYLWPSKSPV